jgi:hypothetical protein
MVPKQVHLSVAVYEKNVYLFGTVVEIGLDAMGGLVLHLDLLRKPANLFQSVLLNADAVKELLDPTQTVHLKRLDISKARVEDLSLGEMSVPLARIGQDTESGGTDSIDRDG